MSNFILWIVIFSLFAVIPAGIVYVMLWSRLIADERRISEALGGRDDINRIDQQYKAVLEQLAHANASILGLDESMGALNNKLNSRERVERMREKREKQEEEQPAKPEYSQEELFPLPPESMPHAMAKPGNGQGRMILKRKEF
jgi:hypothetical protein